MIRRLALLLILFAAGCQILSPEERFMASERERVASVSSMSVRNGKLVIDVRYTLPQRTIETIKTGGAGKEEVIEGAKEIGLALINVIGTVTQPWVAAIPVAGYVTSAIVQKVGDTSFVAYTIEIPLDEVSELDVEFETSDGRKDVRSIHLKGKE